MLSERQLDALMLVFDDRMQQVVDQYLKLMGEHLRDIGQLTPSDVHKLKELKRMGANVKRIKREIAKAAKISLADVEKVFEKVAESNEAFAEQYYSTDHEPPVKGEAQRSKPMERILKAQLRITKQTMQNLSQTTIVSDTYRRAIDVAVQTVQGGLVSYNSAIRDAIKTAGAQGLRVKYPSGYSRRLDSAIRQNVLDGVRAVNNDTLRQLGKEYGADGVEISLHALCATDHLPYQGHRYTNAEFERIQSNLDRPFGQWNCKHTMFPVLMSAPPIYDAQEIEEYRQKSAEMIEIDGRTLSRYEWTQEQRKIETAIRAQKDIANLARAAGLTDEARKASAKIDRLYDRYDQISAAAGLEKQYSRAYVRGYRQTKAGAINAAVNVQLPQTKFSRNNASQEVSFTSGKNEHIIRSENNALWLRNGYDRAVEKGDLSALTDFDHYVNVASQIDQSIVGTTTSDGVAIKGYVSHFIDRIIGSYEQKREGVDIQDVLNALQNPDSIKDTMRSSGIGRQYITKNCKVVLNPENGKLIQVSPKKRREIM